MTFLRSAPAALRNRDLILGVLRPRLPPSGEVLEVASGSGEHIVHFAAALPHLLWRPSDADEEALAAIAVRRAEADLANLLEPVRLDAAAPDSWPVESAEAILCVNLIHIAPWEAAKGLMRGAGRLAPKGGRLFLYGPFREGGRFEAPSNAAFDADLRRRNPVWGVRDREAVVALAFREGLSLRERIVMPANNLVLMFEKR